MKLVMTGSLMLCLLAACSSDETPTSGGSSSGSTTSSSSSGSSGTSGGGTSGATSSSGTNAGACNGDISNCAIGSLSDAQQTDMCSLILAAIDTPPGTKFECKEGEKSGLFLTVNTKEQCVAQKSPPACKVKVGALVDCYKSAKKDACAAFADDGACGPIFGSKECTGG